MFLGRYIRKMGKRSQDALADANVVVEETLQSVHTVKAFANEAFEVDGYRSGLQDVVKCPTSGQCTWCICSVLDYSCIWGITLTIWYGARLIGLDELAVETSCSS